jgi:FlaA1/EpsC-like NDP-sugar epimerase
LTTVNKSPHRQIGLGFLEIPLLRSVIVLSLDVAMAVTCLFLAMLLRFDGRIEQAYWDLLPVYAVTLIVARLASNWSFRLHQWSFRLSGLHDGARIVFAAVAGTAAFIVILFLAHVLNPPRSVVVLELLATAAAMTALRFGPRLGLTYVTQINRVRRGDSRRTLIIGAGAAGEMLLRDLRRSLDHRYRVLGFIDDDQAMWSSMVGGRPVLGGLNSLRRKVEQLRVDTLLVAIPRSSARIVREVVEKCAGLTVQVKVLPVSYIYFQERGAASMLHDLSPQDLLAREPVRFTAQERSTLADRRILVTGAAGSIGSEICRQLLDLGVPSVLGVDINENGLYLLEHQMRKLHPGKLAIDVADIRDQSRLASLMKQFKPQDVFHAAAHKHVPLMESAPNEAIKNNVGGTSHVLHAAEKNGVENFIFISSDKAVAPTSVMGATKRVGELMTRAVAQRSKMNACAVRFGNVLGSEGSVVPHFRQQINAGGPVTITDPEMRRYFMTIPEAVGLVLKAGYGRFGELCMLNMGEPVRILDLAKQMILMAGCVPDVDIQIVYTGLRPGEKLNEELVMENEEVTSRVEGKIQVIAGPPPPADIWQIVGDLQTAAAAEDQVAVLRLLGRLVPTYRHPGVELATAATSQLVSQSN